MERASSVVFVRKMWESCANHAVEADTPAGLASAQHTGRTKYAIAL